jgi:hypothetical protein
MDEYNQVLAENERIYLENWLPWNGAKKYDARPSGMVDVVLRGGTEITCQSADELHWKHIGRGGDIVKWRPAISTIRSSASFLSDPDNFITSSSSYAIDSTVEKPTNPKDTVGIKKAPFSTVSAPVMAEVGVAMMEGALKYGRHNFRGVGVRASVYYDATIRHLFSYWEGEDVDPDSGLSHITKAIASLMVLRDAMIQNKCEDDRPPVSPNFYKELNEKAEKLLERYGNVNPHHYTIKDNA